MPNARMASCHCHESSPVSPGVDLITTAPDLLKHFDARTTRIQSQQFQACTASADVISPFKRVGLGSHNNEAPPEHRPRPDRIGNHGQQFENGVDGFAGLRRGCCCFASDPGDVDVESVSENLRGRLCVPQGLSITGGRELALRIRRHGKEHVGIQIDLRSTHSTL